MSLDGGIYVRTSGKPTQKEVAETIVEYWRANGASVELLREVASVEKLLQMKPLPVKKSGNLGLVVFPAAEKWIAIHDSEPYHADPRLAEHLARALGTPVARFGVSGVSDGYEVHWYGKEHAPASESERMTEHRSFSQDSLPEYMDQFLFPYLNVYYSTLREYPTENFEGCLFIAVSQVPHEPQKLGDYSGLTLEALRERTEREKQKNEITKLAGERRIAEALAIVEGSPSLLYELDDAIRGFDPLDEDQARVYVEAFKIFFARKGKFDFDAPYFYFYTTRLSQYLIAFAVGAEWRLVDDSLAWRRLVDDSLAWQRLNDDSLPWREEERSRRAVLFETIFQSIFEAIITLVRKQKPRLALPALALPLFSRGFPHSQDAGLERASEFYNNFAYTLLTVRRDQWPEETDLRKRLKEAEELATNSANLFYNLGCVYASLGDTQAALRTIRRCIDDLRYAEPEHVHNDRGLKLLWGNPGFEGLFKVRS